MHKQYHLKTPYFYDLIPLLDREFDEKQLDVITDYSAFLDRLLDGNSYIMSFDENVGEKKHEQTRKYKNPARL